MELWVRSQDRKILTQVKELYVTTYSEEKGYGIYDLSYEVDDTDVPLGFYKSKERALEVLDEIQKILMPRITLEPITKKVIDYRDPILRTEQIGSKTVIEEISTYVYEMPQE